MDKKILIIDDSAPICEVIKHVLTSIGLTCITAPNGQEGLEMARRELPDLILVDTYMPVMDGITFYSQKQRDPELETIPLVFMVSGRSDIENMHLPSGNHSQRRFIRKPIEPQTLIDLVTGILNERES